MKFLINCLNKEKNSNAKDEKWEKYIKKIEKANEGYKKCDASNCYFE